MYQRGQSDLKNPEYQASEIQKRPSTTFLYPSVSALYPQSAAHTLSPD